MLDIVSQLFVASMHLNGESSFNDDINIANEWHNGIIRIPFHVSLPNKHEAHLMRAIHDQYKQRTHEEPDHDYIYD